MQESTKGLSFIVPAYNEKKGIAATISRLKDTLKNLDIPTEIIVVNDGSTDKTSDQIMSISDITVIQNPINTGYGNALKAGLCKAKYEWAGMVDADDSYPIEKIPVLVKEMGNGYDMVVCNRQNIRKLDNPIKRVFRSLFVKLIHILNDRAIEDPNSGFRIIKRDQVIRLFPFLCGTFSFTTSLTILMSGLTYFVKYVPLQYKNRTGKTKVRHFRDSLRTFAYIVQGILYFNSLKFYILLSISTIIFVILPAYILVLLGYKDFSFFYLISGLITTLLIGMSALGDITRISLMKRNSDLIMRDIREGSWRC